MAAAAELLLGAGVGVVAAGSGSGSGAGAGHSWFAGKGLEVMSTARGRRRRVSSHTSGHGQDGQDVKCLPRCLDCFESCVESARNKRCSPVHSAYTSSI